MSADLQRIIRIVFKGDNETQKAFGELSRSLDMADTSVRAITKPMADLADSILKAQAAAVTLATGGMALAIQQAGAWSDSFSEISTLTDVTGDSLNTFRQQILDYAAGSTASLEDINAALYAAISAGVDYADSLSLLSTAERLATAGKADLKDSTTLLASTMNAYGASVDEAGRYSDILFQTVRNGQTTLPELAASLSTVTSIAAASGVPLETLAAAIATLTAKGMPTTEAMTAIRGAISAIISPTKEASDYAAELGIEFGASALKANGFEGVLMDVYRTTGGNVEEIAKLFGNVRGLTGVLAAFGQDGGDAFRTNLESMRNSTGATDEAFAKMAENVAQQTQTMVNAMRATLIQAGLPLLEEFGGGVQALTKIFEGLRFGIQDGAFDPLFNAFNDFIRRVIEFGNEVGEALPEALGMVDWSKLIEGFEELDRALGGIFKALFQDLDPSKPEELAQIIQTLADGIGNLAQASSGIIAQWQPLFALLGQLTTGFAGMSGEVAKAQGETLGAAQRFEFLREKLGLLGYPINALIAAYEGITSESTALERSLNSAGGGVGVFRERVAAAIGPVEETGAALSDAAQDTDNLGTKTSWLGTILGNLPGPLGMISRGLEGVGTEAHAATGQTDGLTDALDRVPAETTAHVDFDWDANWDQEFWDAADKDFAVQVRATFDPVKVREDMQIVQDIIDEDGNRTIVIEPKLDPPSLQETEKTIDQLLKEREIEIQLDIAKVQANAEILKSTLQFKAEIDIAQIQADMEIFKAIAEGISETFTGTGDIISSIFGLMANPETDNTTWNLMLDQLKRENNMRREAFELQKALTEEQIETMRARREAMERGDAMITINGEGLQPHLEAFMWEILAAIQTRVNEEGLDMLMGTTEPEPEATP